MSAVPGITESKLFLIREEIKLYITTRMFSLKAFANIKKLNNKRGFVGVWNFALIVFRKLANDRHSLIFKILKLRNFVFLAMVKFRRNKL